MSACAVSVRIQRGLAFGTAERAAVWHALLQHLRAQNVSVSGLCASPDPAACGAAWVGLTSVSGASAETTASFAPSLVADAVGAFPSDAYLAENGTAVAWTLAKNWPEMAPADIGVFGVAPIGFVAPVYSPDCASVDAALPKIFADAPTRFLAQTASGDTAETALAAVPTQNDEPAPGGGPFAIVARVGVPPTDVRVLSENMRTALASEVTFGGARLAWTRTAVLGNDGEIVLTGSPGQAASDGWTDAVAFAFTLGRPHACETLRLKNVGGGDAAVCTQSAPGVWAAGMSGRSAIAPNASGAGDTTVHELVRALSIAAIGIAVFTLIGILVLFVLRWRRPASKSDEDIPRTQERVDPPSTNVAVVGASRVANRNRGRGTSVEIRFAHAHRAPADDAHVEIL